jgi:hypothetical protein
MPHNLLRVPSVKQTTDYSCGSAATLALLRYWRWDLYEGLDERALHTELGTTSSRGTEPEPITAYVNTVPGLCAEYRHGDVTLADLERAVDLRQPPIVDLQAWRDHDEPWLNVWDAGHYVILVGYDDERLFFMDPSRVTPGPYVYMARSELAERWHDLAGDRDERLERMAIFVRSSTTPRATADSGAETLIRLG